MKIARIQDKKGLEEADIVKWEPIDYSRCPELDYLEDENREDLPQELSDLLIEKYQIVKVKTENGRETYLRALRGQFDDRDGRSRTDQFQYGCCDEGLTDREIVKQLEKETGQVLWGCGFEFGYLEVFVPWSED